MTSFGLGGGVFLCMLVVAGYIDVLHITPNEMTAYTVIASLAAWGIPYVLLRSYNRKRKGGRNVKN